MTHYGVDGPGAKFPPHVQTGPGAHPASYTRGNGSSPQLKQLGCGINHPPPSSTMVKQ